MLLPRPRRSLPPVRPPTGWRCIPDSTQATACSRDWLDCCQISVRSRENSSDSSAVRPGASPSQKGTVAGARVRVADGDLAAADVHDPPRGVSQLKNISDLAFDGEVFVKRAHESAFAFSDDPIVGRFRNCAAGSNGRDPRCDGRCNLW